MAKSIVFSLIFMLCGCASNWPFYAPSSESFRTQQDYSHPYAESMILSQSGYKLHFQYHRTSYGPAKGTVLHFHGNRGNVTDTIEKVEWVLDEGFDVIVFDYAGYGQSTGRPSPSVTAQDAQSMLKFFEQVMSLKDEEHQKILWGTSLGGAILLSGVALEAQQQDMEWVDLLIFDSSFYQYLDVSDHVASQYKAGGLIRWALPYLVDDTYSPANSVKSLPEIPYLFVHCETDKLIPAEQSYKLYSQLDAPKAYWALPGCAHARSFTPENARNRVYLLSLLNKVEQLPQMNSFAQAQVTVISQQLAFNAQ